MLRAIREIGVVYGILSPRAFVRWLFALITSLKSAVGARSLHTVDGAFGKEFEVYSLGGPLRFLETDFGVVREVIGHNCYRVSQADLVGREILDLGANVGVFSCFVASLHPDTRVTAVELQEKLVAIGKRNVRVNNLESQVEWSHARVGGGLFSPDSGERSAPMWDPWAYIDTVAVCDLLKCDIEGAEYDLFWQDSLWLQRVQAVTLEAHGSRRDQADLAKRLSSLGYAVASREHGAFSYIYGRRSMECRHG